MRYIYTSEQAKAIDTHAIGMLGFPGLVLMEKAAMAVAAVIMEKESRDLAILCICGMGNNGGDGVEGIKGAHPPEGLGGAHNGGEDICKDPENPLFLV